MFKSARLVKWSWYYGRKLDVTNLTFLSLFEEFRSNLCWELIRALVHCRYKENSVLLKWFSPWRNCTGTLNFRLSILRGHMKWNSIRSMWWDIQISSINLTKIRRTFPILLWQVAESYIGKMFKHNVYHYQLKIKWMMWMMSAFRKHLDISWQ